MINIREDVLTIRERRSLSEIMFNNEALGFRIFCIRVVSVGNAYLVIGDSRVPEILGLSGALISKTEVTIMRICIAILKPMQLTQGKLFPFPPTAPSQRLSRNSYEPSRSITETLAAIDQTTHIFAEGIVDSS
jgi:hypothetical protein